MRIETAALRSMLLVGAISLVGCGAKGIDETYAAQGHEFAFKSNGTMVQSFTGKPVATYKYEVKGNEITIHVNEKTSQVWKIEKDGLTLPNMPVVFPVKR